MTGTTDAEQIDALMSALNRAHAVRDAAAIAAAHAPDALIMDLAPPLARRGLQRAQVQAWLDTWDGPIRIESRDDELVRHGPLAVLSGLVRMRGHQQGTAQDLWFRSTTTLRKRAGRWLIAASHASVPFHMDGSLRAATDLQP